MGLGEENRQAPDFRDIASQGKKKSPGTNSQGFR